MWSSYHTNQAEVKTLSIVLLLLSCCFITVSAFCKAANHIYQLTQQNQVFMPVVSANPGELQEHH